MVNREPEILLRNFPVSHALLMHEGLMTRQLIRLFGPVHANQTGLEVDGDTVTRRSTLHQTASGEPILQATLVISSLNLPSGLPSLMLAGNRLFGALLIEAGVAVRMTDRVIYRTGSSDGGNSGCWGRRQRMLRATDGMHLCDADECLADEATLHRLLLPKAQDMP